MLDIRYKDLFLDQNRLFVPVPFLNFSSLNCGGMWLWMVVFFSWSDLLTELSTWWLSYTMVRHNWKYFLSPDSDVQWNWANKKRKFTIKAIYTLHHFTLHSHPYVSWVIQWFFNHYPIFKIYWILKTLSFQPIRHYYNYSILLFHSRSCFRAENYMTEWHSGRMENIVRRIFNVNTPVTKHQSLADTS